VGETSAEREKEGGNKTGSLTRERKKEVWGIDNEKRKVRRKGRDNRGS